MRIFFLLLTLTLFLATPLASVQASQICVANQSECLVTEVGPFMEGISANCGNIGDCTLEDIMRVFQNVGNWVLGIVGSLVFIMYIIGGFYFLTSRGDQGQITKGKKMLTVSTVGLLIVFFSYIGIQALFLTLYGGGSTSGNYVVCSAEIADETPCGSNMTCTSGVCMTICEQQNLVENPTIIYACLDTDDANNSGLTCTKGTCPGDTSVQCCETGSTASTTPTTSSSGRSGGVSF
jgi:hypothetical protein